MRIILLLSGLLIFILASYGCAAKGGGPLSSEAEPVTLECTTASQLGCRHRGRIYPWNAWVEIKGYSSRQYKVVDVQPVGNKALVQVVERQDHFLGDLP